MTTTTTRTATEIAHDLSQMSARIQSAEDVLHYIQDQDLTDCDTADLAHEVWAIMSAPTKHYRITSSAGQDLGTYTATSPEAALDAMAQDAGYADSVDAAAQVGEFSGTVEELHSHTFTGPARDMFRKLHPDALDAVTIVDPDTIAGSPEAVAEVVEMVAREVGRELGESYRESMMGREDEMGELDADAAAQDLEELGVAREQINAAVAACAEVYEAKAALTRDELSEIASEYVRQMANVEDCTPAAAGGLLLAQDRRIEDGDEEILAASIAESIEARKEAEASDSYTIEADCATRSSCMPEAPEARDVGVTVTLGDGAIEQLDITYQANGGVRHTYQIRGMVVAIDELPGGRREVTRCLGAADLRDDEIALVVEYHEELLADAD
jgi:hypothetical protein